MEHSIVCEKKDTKSRSISLSYDKIVMIYIIGGLVGTLWETVLHYVNHQSFEIRSGSFFTVINPVYGFGLVLITLCLYRVKSNYKLFLYGSLLGGGVEYILNFLQEKILHSRSWDYSERFLNINGRTTLPYMIFWGAGAFVLIRYIVPLLLELIEKIDPKVLKAIVGIMSVIIVIDLASTVVGLLKYSMRSEGFISKTWIGNVIDKIFPDSRVIKFFPNLRKV